MSQPTNDNLYIIGIGTSAGGLEALERFFKQMPADGRFAFVIAQHLSPDYKSHMVELLSKHTTMNVIEAADGLHIQPKTIYLLPPRKNMTVFKRKLYLMDYERSRGLNLPIDILFESLAKDQGDKAIGIILSGTGSDGTRGIRSIKELGGIVLAQDDTARFDGMPRSAIATQLVDYVAAPEDMAEILVRYASLPHGTSQIQYKTLPEENLIGKILAILRDNNSVDFTGYKPNTLVRRIERRMNLNEIETLEDYIRFIQRSDNERTILFKEFLIGVTRFFRDPDAFEFIQSRVIPELLEGKDRREQIRIWVAGCSTGEEAYSLAILFQEYMELSGRFADVKIFATDIDKVALNYAGQGAYPESVLADIPLPLLHNYFIKKGDHYEILRQIRSMVVFAHQNLITDPPFSKIDLISCRNLLIYLQPEVQKKVLSTFQFSLKQNGFLFLGNSESLGDKEPEFIVENSKWKIYRHTGTYVPSPNRDMRTVETTPLSPLSPSYQRTPAVTDWRNSDPVLRGLVEYVLPPSIVVDEKLMMIHGFGDIEPFMRVVKGYQVSLDILKMVNESLSLPLSTALHRTFNEGEEVTYRHLEMQHGEDTIYVNLTTRLFWNQSIRQRLAVILFIPVTIEESDTSTAIGETFHISDGVNQRISNLEQELQYTRENLQATIEELETSNEELQATNEELLAANEELQSTNEELQSVNEELLTVNSEYQAKIRELSALNDDMNNLLKTIDIGTIFLDEQLKLRKFTPAIQRAINIIEQDIGRPIHHFAHNLKDFDLLQIIENVLETLVPQDHEVQTTDDHWHLLRIVPYRTHTNQINGVVITLVDITELKNALSALQETESFSSTILNSLSAHIAVLDEEGTIMRVNDAWERFALENGAQPDDTDVGVNYLEVCKTSFGIDSDEAEDCYTLLKQLLDGEIDEFDLEYPCHSPTEDRWYIMRAVPMKTHGAKRVIVSHINITQRKLIENAFRESITNIKNVMQASQMAFFEQRSDMTYSWIATHDMSYPPMDALGLTDSDVLPSTVAQYLEVVKQEVMDSGHGTEIDFSLVVDGEEISYHLVLQPSLSGRGRVEGIIGLCTPVEIN